MDISIENGRFPSVESFEELELQKRLGSQLAISAPGLLNGVIDRNVPSAPQGAVPV